MLDETDRKLLDIIQTGFPIESKPYAILGEKVGITEENAFARIQRLRRENIIRRIGANFQS